MTNSLNSLSLPNALWTEMLHRNPDDAYAWRMVHRRLGGESLRHLPLLMDIARDTSADIVIMKSAQVGATELAVDLALWAADRKYAGRGHVLYLMHT